MVFIDIVKLIITKDDIIDAIAKAKEQTSLIIYEIGMLMFNLIVNCVATSEKLL